jgi:hypothetical protein
MYQTPFSETDPYSGANAKFDETNDLLPSLRLQEKETS